MKSIEIYSYNFECQLPCFRLVLDTPSELNLFEKEKISSSKDVFLYAKETSFYKENAGMFEAFGMIFLNRMNKPIGCFKVSEGGTSSCIVDIKKVFASAVCANASGIIAFHNHPSGNLNPSEQDKGITKKLLNAGLLLDIPLLDHIIIGDGTDKYFSFADEGIL